MSVPSFIRSKVWEPLAHLLRNGMAPGQLAKSVALGAYLGIIPVLGVTTLLCALVALPLRLNLVAIQAVNWLVYPLQFVLILPFFRAGEWLFRQPALDLSPDELVAMIKHDTWGSIQTLWGTTWHAVVVWFLIGLPVVFLTQRILASVFFRLSLRMRHPFHAREVPLP